jgi:superfamily II DNA or RNA helicase
MIEIRVRNVYSKLTDYTQELFDLLTVPYPNYWFSKKYQEGLWTGMHNFLKVPSLKFPTGLLFIVEDYFRDKGIEYRKIDQREIPQPDYGKLSVDNKVLNEITLRDYQVESITESIVKERGILEIATGLGKTEIAAAITKLLDFRTLFLVHKQDLLYQTKERFEKRIGCDIGIIGDSEFQIDPDIIIATVQSIDSKMFEKNEKGRVILNKKTGKVMKEFLNTFDVLFFDECHHASASTWFRIGMYMHNAYYRFGLSGTPLKRTELANMKLTALTGDVIYSKLAEEGIEEGYLSGIKITIIDNDEEVYSLSSKWQELYEAAVIRSKHRNSLIAEIAADEWKKKKRVLVLVRQIEHGRVLTRMLVNNHHVPTKFIYGRNKAWERSQVKH